MGIEEGDGGGGTLALGTECIKTGFHLLENNPGKLVWVQRVRHVYLITETGNVMNNADQGFNYPDVSQRELEELIDNKQALVLRSLETALNDIVNFSTNN